MDRRQFLGTLASAVVASPSVLHAQGVSMPVVGFLSPASSDGFAYVAAAFRQGLQESGFTVGQNVQIEYRWGEGHDDRLPALAAELIQRNVAVIATGGGSAADLAAKRLTATIPIVFVTGGGDPVKVGLVASLNRPGGNITGITFLTTTLDAKRLGLLHETVPSPAAITVLVNSASTIAGTQEKEVQMAARTLGRRIRIVNAANELEIDSAFAAIVQSRPAALLVSSNPFFNGRRQQLVDLAARYAVPAMYELREFAAIGGLMSYGSSITNAYRQMGIYVGAILKGAKPADMPVLQPTKFELVINLKTAKTLGLAIPPSVLLRADEVIQ